MAMISSASLSKKSFHYKYLQTSIQASLSSAPCLCKCCIMWCKWADSCCYSFVTRWAQVGNVWMLRNKDVNTYSKEERRQENCLSERETCTYKQRAHTASKHPFLSQWTLLNNSASAQWHAMSYISFCSFVVVPLAHMFMITARNFERIRERTYDDVVTPGY